MGITPQQLKEIQERLSAPRRTASPAFASSPTAATVEKAVILGIDPSLRGTGFGVIRWEKAQPRALGYGMIACPASWPQSRCLVKISQSLRDVVKEYQPRICVVEGVFYAQNLQTAIIMGQARGAALAAVAEAGIEIYELATRKVKQAIVGYGAAQKLAVAKMVQGMLRLTDLPEPDAADALALALAHGQENSRYSLKPRKRI